MFSQTYMVFVLIKCFISFPQENPSTSTPSKSSRVSHFPLDNNISHNPNSDRKKKGHFSSQSSHRTHKLLASGSHRQPPSSVKKKLKKKKRKRFDSDSDDSDDDPDFVG